MSFRSPVRILSLTATAAVGLSMTLLAAPAAQAAPVFIDAQTHLSPFADLFTDDVATLGTDCTSTDPGTIDPSVAVVENGPAATASVAISGTYANAGNVADTGSGASSASGNAKVASAGGTLSTMDFATQSSAQLSNALGTSPDCYRSTSAGVSFDFQFTVAQAGFLTLTGKNLGGSYGAMNIGRITTNGEQIYAGSTGSGLKANFETKVFLDVGTYGGSFQGTAFVNGASGSSSGTSTVHGDFAVAGSQTEAVSGKGKKYVSAPAARSCSTDTLVPSITKKKNRASKIQQVTFFVNDKKVKKVKTPKKGAEIKLPVADDVTADLVAEVTLFPAKKGKPGKVYEVSSSYEACS